jgi:hypothetical protein
MVHAAQEMHLCFHYAVQPRNHGDQDSDPNPLLPHCRRPPIPPLRIALRHGRHQHRRHRPHLHLHLPVSPGRRRVLRGRRDVHRYRRALPVVDADQRSYRPCHPAPPTAHPYLSPYGAPGKGHPRGHVHRWRFRHRYRRREDRLPPRGTQGGAPGGSLSNHHRNIPTAQLHILRQLLAHVVGRRSVGRDHVLLCPRSQAARDAHHTRLVSQVFASTRGMAAPARGVTGRPFIRRQSVRRDPIPIPVPVLLDSPSARNATKHTDTRISAS